MKQRVLMIGTAGGLAEMVARGRECESIALDTEFVWERTYYPRLGLIQVAFDRNTCFLVDTLAVEDLRPLGELLAAPHVVKILHDAPQDLTILRRVTGAYPVRVFDTRCAAALAGLSSTLSLAGLVAATVGVDLAKTESRTNWLQRPLSAAQVEYAADDVCHLHDVRAELERRVEARGRGAWLREELATLDDAQIYAERDPRTQYLRIKGAGNMSRRESLVLRELAAWREEEARRRDRPRGHVVADSVLVQLARLKPRSPEALRDLPGRLSRHARAVIECVERGMAAEDAGGSSARRRSRAADKVLENLTSEALARIRACARIHEIDPPFIASRAEIRALLSAGPSASPSAHRLLRGWRRELIGHHLLSVAQEGSNSP